MLLWHMQALYQKVVVPGPAHWSCPGASATKLSFIKGEDKVLSPAIRAEITNAVFSR